MTSHRGAGSACGDGEVVVSICLGGGDAGTGVMSGVSGLGVFGEWAGSSSPDARGVDSSSSV